MPISYQREIPAQSPPLTDTEMQTSFIGGMNLLTDETKINDNQYREAFNCTNRFDVMLPFNDHNPISEGLPLPIQGGTNAGIFVIIFAGGSAYYRAYNGYGFTKINGFRMSSGVPVIYCQPVPASYFNLDRKLLPQVDMSGNAVNPNLNTQSSFTSGFASTSPSCIVCQDGVTQPFIIFIDPVSNQPAARTLQTYNEWAVEAAGTTNLREYVPIGTIMLYYAGILFVVDPTGTQIYRSVLGRPLDFVVNVTFTGDKGGDATTTAYSVGYSQIVALYLASGYQGFIVSLLNNSSIGVTLDLTDTIFGEPTFGRDPLFGTGPLNHFSTVDILGDTGFIDGYGVKSFNASKQTKIETNNSVFSLTIATLFENVFDSSNTILQQSNTVAATVFKNYAMFSVQTLKYGYKLVLYDTFNKCWVSMVDLGGAGIKQFISLMPNANKLYAITTDNRIFDVFASGNLLDASFNTCAFSYSNISYEQKLFSLRVCVKNSNGGMLTITPSVDQIARVPMNKPINGKRNVNNLLFVPVNAYVGWQIGYNISWTGGGTIVNLCHKGEIIGLDQSLGQESQVTQGNPSSNSS
jgi:hypothetical protein